MSEAQSFGGPHRYYDKMNIQRRRPGDESEEEKKVRRLLGITGADVRAIVEKACKQWNRPIRESIRIETAFKLSVRDERKTVPIKVVDGLPQSFIEIVHGIDNPLIWKLISNRTLLQYAQGSCQILAGDLEEIKELFDIEQPVTKRELDLYKAFIDRILKKLNEYNLPERIKKIREDVFGSYYFRVPAIQIYWMPIGLVAGALNVPVEALTIVILTHELAHAYTHLGQDTNNMAWETDVFAATDLRIVEGIAQYYTAVVEEKMDPRQPGMMDAFNKLLKMQSEPYTIFKNWITNASRTSEIIRYSMISARVNRQTKYNEFEAEMKEIRGSLEMQSE